MSKLDRQIHHFEDITITYYPDNGEVVDVDVNVERCGQIYPDKIITPVELQDKYKYQRRHRERNASRGEQFYKGIDEDKETKQCTNCKRILPLSGFQRDIRKLNGYSAWCKDCEVEYQFLYADRKGKRGYLYGTGICLVCGELTPLLMENHHLFGRKTTDDVVSLCSNCHTLHRYYPLTLWPQLREEGPLGNPEQGP